MRENLDEKRKKRIKLCYQFFSTKCDSCKEFIRGEKMWKVSRYNIIGTKTWHYCQNCMKSKEEVLREIDTDACSYGIVGIDSRMGFKKKDNTKCREAVRRARKILENKNSSI